MVAHLKDDRFTRGRPYRGNEPSDENLKQQFTESGFYNYVVSSQRPKNPNYGSIRARHKVKVDGERAAELIHFGTEKLFGEIKRCPGVYNALVESMNNTRDHAAASKKHRERWWASVHHDRDRRKLAFSFVDNGVGIFRSKSPTILADTLRRLSLTRNSELLRKMLRGEIPSSTQIPYRGLYWEIKK